jgi:hypothetical protein
MNKVNHSKYKNTGIIFEMLVRQLTNESLTNQDPKAIGLIKKYFTKTELAKENKLYQTIIQSESLNESKAETTINTVVELNKKLNRKQISKDKFNLIKEIKSNYDIDNFFKSSIGNYKALASVYTLLESNYIDDINPTVIINSKINIKEYLTENKIPQDSPIYNELSKMEKGERFLVYKLMVENFNKKYIDLDKEQKNILREYINNVSDPQKIKSIINSNLIKLKEQLLKNIDKVTEQITKIKIEETIKMIDPILESNKMKDDYLIALFNYQELNKELSELK